MIQVPFYDLRRQIDPIAESFRAVIDELMLEPRFVKGPRVAAFEAAWAAACGVKHAVCCSSGTTALELALRVAGIGPCDEVICPAMTFGATLNAILTVGARPVLADVDPQTLLITPKSVASSASPRTKAVIPVHLYGRPARVAKLRNVLGDGVTVIEDACQAHLGVSVEKALEGRRAGALGDVAAFSFYPAKNLGACGDGGAMVTQDDDLAERARRLRDHGRSAHTEHFEPGYNYRMDELTGAWLGLQLPLLEARTAERARLATAYNAALEDLEWLQCPPLSPPSVWHLYVVRCADRDRLRDHLASQGVASAIHYPRAIHQHPAFTPYFAGESYPVTERAVGEILSLPLFPGMTEDEQARVVEVVRSFSPAA